MYTICVQIKYLYTIRTLTSTGFNVIDSSMPKHHPDRKFNCKALMLLWTGDRPAQCKVAGLSLKRCHWCHYRPMWSRACNRLVWGDYRSFLPKVPLHPYRTSSSFGRPCLLDPPVHRSHESFLQAATDQVDYLKQRTATGNPLPANAQPWHDTGIKEMSALFLFPLFNMTWDVAPDGMHTIPNYAEDHLFPLWKGLRTPAKPRPLKLRDENDSRGPWTEEDNERVIRAWEELCEHLDTWTLSKVRDSHTHPLSTILLQMIASVRKPVRNLTLGHGHSEVNQSGFVVIWKYFLVGRT